MSVTNYNINIAATNVSIAINDGVSAARKPDPLIDTWNDKKRAAAVLAHKLQTSGEKEARDDAAAMNGCASFISAATCPEHGTRRVVARLCRLRLCPVCEWRRARTNQYIISEVIKRVKDEYKLLHIVLTVRSVPGKELSGCIDSLLEAYKRFTRRKSIHNVFVGSVRKLELTYNDIADTYHPHIHLLVAVKSSYFGQGYISHAKYTKLWKEALGVDYDPQVSVTSCKDGKIAFEIGKYTLKSSVDEENLISDEVYLTIKHALKGRRLIQYSGVLADVRKSLKELPEDDTEGDELEQISKCDICGAELYKVLKQWEHRRYIDTDF
jgi:plasmid rolling circle replication initiator protein Rep